MAYKATKFDFEYQHVFVPEHDAGGMYHLAGADAVDLEAPVWLKKEHHVTAVIQTAHVDITRKPQSIEARNTVYDDVMVIDVRKVPTYADAKFGLRRKFGALLVEPDVLFLLVHGLSYNERMHHGYKALRLGERVVFGSATGVPSIDERFRGLSVAASPDHFAIAVDDVGDVRIQNMEAPLGTHVYTGKYASERLRWSDTRLQAAAGERTGLMRRILGPN